MKRILIAHEKHQNRYFDISTDAKWVKVCLRLLAERLAAGFYDVEQPPTIKTSGKIPSWLEHAAQHELVILKSQQKHYERASAFLAEVHKILDTKCADVDTRGTPFAYRLLARGGEYEQIEIEYLENV